MLKVMIVDDEKPAIKKLAHLLASIENVTICGQYTNPVQALEEANSLQPHIVFLDIEMPVLNGLEAAEQLLVQLPQTEIIFVTAYDKYALEAFEVQAVDYLLKPVKKERLGKALRQIEKRISLNQGRKLMGQGNSFADSFLIQCLGKLDLVKNGVPLNISWRSARVRELFGFYLHYRNENLHRDKILDALWGEMGYERALVNFNTCNYQLKRQLSEIDAGIAPVYSAGYYKLDLGGASCDADLFTDMLGNITAINDDNIDGIKNALKMYRGFYFENLNGTWLDNKRYLLEDIYISGMVRLADYYLKKGSNHECITYAEDILGRNSLCEEGWSLLLHALKNQGDRMAYKEKYDEMQRLFKEELGSVPKIK